MIIPHEWFILFYFIYIYIYIYFISFSDDHIRFMYLYLLNNKADVLNAFSIPIR